MPDPFGSRGSLEAAKWSSSGKGRYDVMVGKLYHGFLVWIDLATMSSILSRYIQSDGCDG